MRIQHNIMAMSAYRNYTNNVAAMKKNLEKLSSGYKINRAGDDAAGLAISEKMRAQITGLETAQKNAKDGISLVQTAEGALTEVHDMLNRMVELATQSANGTYEDTTDRTQLQKEVDQLLDEIDRIAESSNFNGIKLLDGTLGMNTDAFSVGDTVDATEAVAAGTSTLTVTAAHGGAGATAVPAELTVDLKALEVKITGSAAAKGSITIKVGSSTISLASLAGAAAGSKTYTASDIAGAIKAAYTGADAAHSLKIGDAYFKGTTTTDGKITFEYVGYDKNGTFTADANGTGIGSAAVKTLNGKLAGAKVEVVAGTKATLNSKDAIDHGITYTAAVAQKDGGLLGGEIELTETMITDGAALTIDDKTFTFVVKGSGTAGDFGLKADGANFKVVVDSRKFGTPAEQLAEAKRLLTTGSTTNFDINTAAGNKISIDQKATTGGTPTNTKNYKSMADVPVKVTTKAQAAKGAGVKLTVTDSEIKDGNVLSVDGKKYVFNTKGVDPDPTTTEKDTQYIKVSDGIDGLKTALETDGYTVEKNGDELTIRTKVEAGADPLDTKAPVVLGKGLTLQIADTSAPYNQLNVAVQDCHTNSLGIKDLDISTEEAAQAAIDKIRNAINYVSDVRGTLGATQNRLDHTINNLSVMTENIQDAESTIRDVDVAEEMMAYTKNNILIQSAQAMLAQANQVPQGVLQLLQ